MDILIWTGIAYTHLEKKYCVLETGLTCCGECFMVSIKFPEFLSDWPLFARLPI